MEVLVAGTSRGVLVAPASRACLEGLGQLALAFQVAFPSAASLGGGLVAAPERSSRGAFPSVACLGGDLAAALGWPFQVAFP